MNVNTKRRIRFAFKNRWPIDGAAVLRIPTVAEPRRDGKGGLGERHSVLATTGV
jgi:hypothetical protein